MIHEVHAVEIVQRPSSTATPPTMGAEEVKNRSAFVGVVADYQPTVLVIAVVHQSLAA